MNTSCSSVINRQRFLFASRSAAICQKFLWPASCSCASYIKFLIEASCNAAQYKKIGGLYAAALQHGKKLRERLPSAVYQAKISVAPYLQCCVIAIIFFRSLSQPCNMALNIMAYLLQTCGIGKIIADGYCRPGNR